MLRIRISIGELHAPLRIILLTLLISVALAGISVAQEPFWNKAKQQANIHRFSTLFTAQDVRDSLSSGAGLKTALDWCQRTAVTKVYIETFRDGYQADRATLEKARDEFRRAGFVVSGCVTPTKVGKRSTRWSDAISCYTDEPTQQKLEEVFKYAAGLFDEIMIDDFWFTDCTCPECDAARKTKTVTIGQHTYPVSGDTWEDYRCELMVRLSRERVLGPAKSVNANARLIIKYPQWYDQFHERGYEVIRETTDFDRTWVGTETRDYGDRRWGGTPQYEGYFIMRWLGGIGGDKCGGGWFDPFGTTDATYLEQARQTILGGARESMLFCYGALQRNTGPKNIEALRTNIPELLAVAKEVRKRPIVGVAAYKPANSHPENEPRIFDFIGMLGFPLVPCHEFPAEAPAGFFSVHALKDPDLAARLDRFLRAGKPTIVTSGLAAALAGKVKLDAPNARILALKPDPKSLLELQQADLDALRAPALKPFQTSFQAPSRVALFLFKDQSWVVENFNDKPARVSLNGKEMSVPARGWICQWK